jgi:mono/diheme cytochrome c family protein
VDSDKARTKLKLGMVSLVAALALAPVGQLLARQAEAPKAAAGDAVKGKSVFDGASCGVCHALEAAGASGDIGPSLDHNANLTHDFIIARVTHGQGAMPPLAGTLSEAEIEDVTAYVLSAAAK